MRELKLSSPLNIQIITEPERMALRIALDKSIGENLGMVLAHQLEDARSAAAVMCARNGMQGMVSRHGAELQAGQEGM